MPEPDVHLRMLRCPWSTLPLRPATDAELAEIDSRLSGGTATTVGGNVLRQEIGSAVVSMDGRFLYPVLNGIYGLLRDAALPLRPGDSDGRTSATPSEVQRFYEEVGWQSEGSRFADEQLFEDSRDVSADYRRACNARITARLPSTGRYLLDAASGPVQYEDYLNFSRGFDYRVCVDFSLTALRQAKKKIGSHGVYVLGDVTNLPIGSARMDAAVSLHTIYHVPAERQATAFLELYRVLRERGTAVVVYSWGKSPLTAILHTPIRARSALARRTRRSSGDGSATPAGPELYFAPQTYRWFVRQAWPFSYEITSWRSVSVPSLRHYVPESKSGRRRLQRLEKLEQRFPRAAGRLGQYPLISLRRD